MKCVNCGEEIPEDSSFCLSCGRPAPSPHPTMDSGMACGVCGAPLTFGDNFCCACGTPVLWDGFDEDDPAAEAPVRWKMPEEDRGRFTDSPEKDRGRFSAMPEEDYDPEIVPDEIDEEEDREPSPVSPRLKGSLVTGERKPGRPEDYGRNELFDKAGDL